MQINRKETVRRLRGLTVHGAFIYMVKIVVTIVGVPSVYHFFLITLICNYSVCKTEWNDLASVEMKTEL